MTAGGVKVAVAVVVAVEAGKVEVISRVEAGWIDIDVVVPCGRLIRLVYVTAGWMLVEITTLVAVVVAVDAGKVEVTAGKVEVIRRVEAGWIDIEVVVPCGRLIRLVKVTAGCTLVETTILVAVVGTRLVTVVGTRLVIVNEEV